MERVFVEEHKEYKPGKWAQLCWKTFPRSYQHLRAQELPAMLRLQEALTGVCTEPKSWVLSSWQQGCLRVRALIARHQILSRQDAGASPPAELAQECKGKGIWVHFPQLLRKNGPLALGYVSTSCALLSCELGSQFISAFTSEKLPLLRGRPLWFFDLS